MLGFSLTTVFTTAAITTAPALGVLIDNPTFMGIGLGIGLLGSIVALVGGAGIAATSESDGGEMPLSAGLAASGLAGIVLSAGLYGAHLENQSVCLAADVATTKIYDTMSLQEKEQYTKEARAIIDLGYQKSATDGSTGTRLNYDATKFTIIPTYGSATAKQTACVKVGTFARNQFDALDNKQQGVADELTALLHRANKRQQPNPISSL